VVGAADVPAGADGGLDVGDPVLGRPPRWRAAGGARGAVDTGGDAPGGDVTGGGEGAGQHRSPAKKPDSRVVLQRGTGPNPGSALLCESSTKPPLGRGWESVAGLGVGAPVRHVAVKGGSPRGTALSASRRSCSAAALLGPCVVARATSGSRSGPLRPGRRVAPSTLRSRCQRHLPRDEPSLGPQVRHAPEAARFLLPSPAGTSVPSQLPCAASCRVMHSRARAASACRRMHLSTWPMAAVDLPRPTQSALPMPEGLESAPARTRRGAATWPSGLMLIGITDTALQPLGAARRGPSGAVETPRPL